MGAYDPNPTFSIDSQDFTSQTINSISSTLGRSTVDEQPRAGYCTVNLVVTDGSYPAIQLNQPGHVTINDKNGAPTRVFTGYVTDVVRSIAASGSTGTTYAISVTMIGPLARLSRILTESTYPKQFDGDRIEAIVTDFVTTSWDEVAPSLKWSAVPATKTWETYDPGFVGVIDTPGSYEVTAYAGGQTNALTHASDVANSALGVLWEDQNGNLNYSDAASRINDVAQNGYLTLDASLISPTGLVVTSVTADLINSMTLSYKNNATKTGEDAESIATYGRFDARRNTLLENGTDAQAQLDKFLSTRSYPRQTLKAVTIPLHNPAMDDTFRDDLIQAYMGRPISIPNLPSAIYGEEFRGFIEGGTMAVTRHTAFLTLQISEYGLSEIQEAWLQVPAAERWNTLSSSLKWEDAEVVA